jgi:hypothetical protein
MLYNCIMHTIFSFLAIALVLAFFGWMELKSSRCSKKTLQPAISREREELELKKEKLRVALLEIEIQAMQQELAAKQAK